MNCNVNENEWCAWVILDQNGNFAHRGSIRKTDKDTYQYIAFKIFSPECRAYVTKPKAELALSELNKKKAISGLEVNFHLEYVNLDKIIIFGKGYQGETLVVLENVSTNNSCNNARKEFPVFKQTCKCRSIHSSSVRDMVNSI